MAELRVPEEVVALELDSSGLRKLLDYLLEQSEAGKAALDALRREHAQELEGVRKELERVDRVEEDVKVCFGALQRVDDLIVMADVGKNT